MALFFPGISCALYGYPIEGPESWIGFAALPSTVPPTFDDLSDTCVHRHCLTSWEHRDAFVAHYNLIVGEWAKGRVSKLAIKPDGDVVHEIDDWGFGRVA